VSSQPIIATESTEGREITDTQFLQPPAGRRYVRSFLFARHVDAPLARVHFLARIVLVLCLSGALLRTINSNDPDLWGACLFWIGAMALFVISGIQARIARFYLLLTLPTLFALFLTWNIFFPVRGNVTLWQHTVYNGTFAIGIAGWFILWLLFIAAYYWWRRALVSAIVLASLFTFILTRFVVLPEWTFAQFAFFHPLTIMISDRGIIVALTKVVGYSGMIISTIALVVTSRDTELLGLLRQLRVPRPIIFFLSTVFRALTLALLDYETIHQAQIARAVNARPRSFIRRLRDLASVAIPMVAMMIRRSSEMGDALLARGYTMTRPTPDFYETTPLRSIDWVILVISLGLLYFALGPHPTISALL
jgi:energy-coupling factor transporter transmembrane protein EcfT